MQNEMYNMIELLEGIKKPLEPKQKDNNNGLTIIVQDEKHKKMLEDL